MKSNDGTTEKRSKASIGQKIFAAIFGDKGIVIIIAGVGLIFMMMVIAINVIGRAFFSAPLLGTLELTQLSGVLMISFGLCYTELSGRNVAIDILTRKLSPLAQACFELFGSVFSAVTVALLSWTSYNIAIEKLPKREVGEVLKISVAPFRFLWAFGCVLLLVAIIINCVRTVGKIRRLR